MRNWSQSWICCLNYIDEWVGCCLMYDSELFPPSIILHVNFLYQMHHTEGQFCIVGNMKVVILGISWFYDCFVSKTVFIPPSSTKLKGGYTGFTLSVCPSIRPSVDRIVSSERRHSSFLGETTSLCCNRCHTLNISLWPRHSLTHPGIILSMNPANEGRHM